MLRLMIADSFHPDIATPQSLFYIIWFSFYTNFVIRIADSGYGFAISLLLLFMLLSLAISPIRLAKGLYLCPLTEEDRKNYLKLLYVFRLTVFEVIIIILLIICRLIYHFELLKLLITFLSFTGVLITSVLLTGFYNPRIAKQQYYIANKLPVPQELKNYRDASRTPSTGTYMLILALVLCCFGMFLSFRGQAFDLRWLFYYIPALIISIVCLLVYFTRYFDLFITINANHEVYSYTRKKKAGVFYAD